MSSKERIECLNLFHTWNKKYKTEVQSCSTNSVQIAKITVCYFVPLRYNDTCPKSTAGFFFCGHNGKAYALMFH